MAGSSADPPSAGSNGAPGGYGADDGVPPAAPAPPPLGYGETPVAPRNRLGVASLVVGIAALLFAVFFFPLGLVLALVGVGLGFAGLRRVRSGLATNHGLAITGLALSVFALLVAVLSLVVVGSLFAKTKDCADPDLSRAEQRQCVKDKLN